VSPADSNTPTGNQANGPSPPPAVSSSHTINQFGADGQFTAPGANASGSQTAGRYRILRPHAHGGLGEVFLAHDDELGRDVALKRLRFWRADDPGSRRRFVAEAAVTARLEHPGVVPVHGLVQDADGRPAYAMRFIQGDTLDDAIKHFHEPAGGDDGKRSTSEIILEALTGPQPPRFDSLEFRQMLSRFVAVCNAIAYAHSRNIIHRDLKPANIMLGPFGETLVVDWGLAKDLNAGADDSLTATENLDQPQSGPQPFTIAPSNAVTQAGEILGTPAYMAPEQADGQVVGPAADVYGLGAILYTLLTGARPVPGGNPQVVLDKVRRGAIAPPRTVIPGVPRPLDAACGKAMALDPAARYPSAMDLAADVERWLADAPVSADRETKRERVRRWGRRHRPVVAAGIALLVAAVVGLGITTAVVSSQQAATAAAKKRAEEQRDLADQNLRLAGRAVDAAARRVSGHPRLMAGDFHDLRADLLAALIPFYEELARRTGDDPAVEEQSALAYGWLGNLRREMGQTDQAERDFRAMVAAFNRMTDRDPGNADIRRRLAQAHNDLGNLLADFSRWTDARRELEETVRLERAAVAAAPTDPGARHSLAVGLDSLGVTLQHAGSPAEAEAIFREGLGLARALSAAAPGDQDLTGLCAAIENNLAVLLKAIGRPAQAEPLLRSAIGRRTALATANPTDRYNRRELVTERYNLANLLLTDGRWPAAEAEYRTVVALSETLAANFAFVPDYRADLARGLSSLATVFAMTDRLSEAADLHRRAAGLLDRLTTDFPSNTFYRKNAAECWYNLGTVTKYLDRPADAEAAYRKAADEYARLAAAAPTDPKATADLAVTWVTIGDLVRTTGSAAAALDWYDKAIARLAGAPGDGALRDAHAGRAESLSALGKLPDALTEWNTALGLDPARKPSLRLRWARTLVAAGDHRRAATEARELTTSPKTNGDTLDAAARILSLAAAAAKSDPSAVNNGYAADAVVLLRRAHAAGQYREPGSADKLRGDADFAVLRDRDDFGKFLAQVGK
jgi:serine/threonine protein kinase/tetratricopeptide (TPR) repeat protein